MHCSKCGAENRNTARFCDDCGAPTQPQCPSCGGLGRLGARFCDVCSVALSGAPLGSAAAASASAAAIQFNSGVAAPEALEGERKTVMALFAQELGGA
jgi:hypothetical protein